jgi:hypothetical protein
LRPRRDLVHCCFLKACIILFFHETLLSLFGCRKV